MGNPEKKNQGGPKKWFRLRLKNNNNAFMHFLLFAQLFHSLAEKNIVISNRNTQFIHKYTYHKISYSLFRS